MQPAIRNTLWELIGHLMGTHWELDGTCWEQRKNEKNPPLTLATQNLKEKNIQALWMHASAYPLATCIFGFQNCWSLYMASANGRGENWTRKKNKKQISTHSWMLQFFFLFEWERGQGFFPPPCSQCVPIMSPNGFPVLNVLASSSQTVPKCSPEDVPNSTWVYPVWSAQSSIPMDIKWKGDNLREHTCFYFATQDPKRCFYWGHAQCSDKIADGSMNMAPFKNFKRL
jgi:hypothetical protein